MVKGLGGNATGTAGQAEGAAKALGGLFGKKKN